MKRTDWGSFAKQARLQRKNIKNLLSAAEYLSEIPSEGYFKDNISKKTVLIKECKSSTLRRYAKLLENYFYLVETRADREKILKKQTETQNELSCRLDGILPKNED